MERYIGQSGVGNKINSRGQVPSRLLYFDLVRYYGRVPVIDHPVSASEAITIGQWSMADIYALIIGDLQFAIANLTG